MASSIDEVFEHFGIEFVPHIVRYVLCGLIITSPLLGLIFMTIYMESDGDDDDSLVKYATSKALKE